ncbi:MAG: hypothetical protein R3A44_10345 [Caldilineaceae bacterium]
MSTMRGLRWNACPASSVSRAITSTTATSSRALLRKPGGFRRYRFREDLFPRLIFRRAWEQLNQWHTPRKADIIYLQILHLAARTLEEEGGGGLGDIGGARHAMGPSGCGAPWQPEPVVVPYLEAGAVDLHHYDQLLEEVLYEPA